MLPSTSDWSARMQASPVTAMIFDIFMNRSLFDLLTKRSITRTVKATNIHSETNTVETIRCLSSFDISSMAEAKRDRPNLISIPASTNEEVMQAPIINSIFNGLRSSRDVSSSIPHIIARPIASVK